MSQHVVVIFGSAAPEWCELSHCPMESFGPFSSHSEAEAFSATFPDSFQPHVLRLSEPTL